MFESVEYKFNLSSEEIDHISILVEENLTKLEMERKDISRIRIGIEEMLLNLLQHSEGNEGIFSFYKKWGRPRILIKVKGMEPEEQTEEDEFNEYVDKIMENIGLKPETFHKAGWNHISIKLNKKKVNPLVNIGIAAVLAVVIGLSTSAFLPSSTGILSALTEPLLETFLGILSTISGPMIFLSVAWGIICIGDTATLGSIGKKMMLRFISLSFLVSIISFFACNLFFDMKHDASEVDISQFSSIYEMVLNIIPRNLVKPFYDNNSMQIIVLAIAVGIAVLALERKTVIVAKFVEQLNYIVQFLMEKITKLLPLFVFLSLLQMFLNNSLSGLSGCWKMILMIIGLPLIMAAVIILYISVKMGVKASLLVRKLMPTFMIGFATASSAAAFSTNMETCENELGMDQKITRFGIPLGMVIYMPVVAVLFTASAMYMASAFEVSISLEWIIICILSTAILAIAAPPIPGGSLTCYTILFAQLGIPVQAIAIATIVDVFTDFYCTAMGLTFLQLELLMQANSMNLVEKTILGTDPLK